MFKNINHELPLPFIIYTFRKITHVLIHYEKNMKIKSITYMKKKFSHKQRDN